MKTNAYNLTTLSLPFIGFGLAVCGCVVQDQSAMHVTDQSALSVPLLMPNLGESKFPQDVPYPEKTLSRTAYLRGFVAGWEIIQDMGEGALVVMPHDYTESREAQVAWNKGVHDGKEAAYKTYKQQLTAQPYNGECDEEKTIRANLENSQ